MTVILMYSAAALGFLFYTLCDQLAEAGFPQLYLCLAGLMIFGVSMITSMFSVAYQVFSGKDTEMLLALPVSKRDIVLSRLTGVLAMEALFSSIVIAPAYIVYAVICGFRIVSVLLYLLGSISLIFIATGIGSAVSAVIYKVSGLINNKVVKTILSTVLMVGFIGAYSVGMSTLQAGIAKLILMGDRVTGFINSYAKPLIWFAEGTEGKALSLIPLMLIGVVILAATAALLIKGFDPHAKTDSRKAGKNETAKRTASASKGRSPVMAIALKDVSRFLSNAGLLMNGGLGSIFALAAGIIFAVKSEDIAASLPGLEWLIPLIAVGAVAMCCSMTMGSCAFLSLEGRNLWVLKSAPISGKDVLLSKSLAHMIVLYPTVFIGSVALCFMPGTTPVIAGIYILLPFATQLCIALWGSVTNLMLPKFDWENEVVAIKQSIGSLVGMLGSMALVAACAAGCYGMIRLGAAPVAALLAVGAFLFAAAGAAYVLICSAWAERKYASL